MDVLCQRCGQRGATGGGLCLDCGLKKLNGQWQGETQNPTTSQLIPHELQTRLLQVRGAGDAEFWEVGDVSAELVDEAPDKGVKKAAIRIAIANLVGLKAATVRDYEACARFYPTQARAGRYPNLTRWHYRYAKRAGTLAEAEKWLKRAEESADDYHGLPMPVDVLAALITAQYGAGSLAEDDEDYLPVWKFSDPTVQKLIAEQPDTHLVILQGENWEGQRVKLKVKQ